MKFEAYLTALRHAAVLVGNSSSGIHEAPIYGVPTVNVGSRQHNRSRCASIVNVPFDVDRVVEAVERVWGERLPPATDFGTGASATAFLAIIRTSQTWDTRVLKQFRD